MRIRTDVKANYKAIFFDYKTVRMRIDNTKPITVPKHPEIEDVAINSKCLANCSYCYINGTYPKRNILRRPRFSRWHTT
jgi:sulfatase maturation enzyme AslB (radical SAM superfamily)